MVLDKIKQLESKNSTWGELVDSKNVSVEPLVDLVIYAMPNELGGVQKEWFDAVERVLKSTNKELEMVRKHVVSRLKTQLYHRVSFCRPINPFDVSMYETKEQKDVLFDRLDRLRLDWTVVPDNNTKTWWWSPMVSKSPEEAKACTRRALVQYGEELLTYKEKESGVTLKCANIFDKVWGLPCHDTDMFEEIYHTCRLWMSALEEFRKAGGVRYNDEIVSGYLIAFALNFSSATLRSKAISRLSEKTIKDMVSLINKISKDHEDRIQKYVFQMDWQGVLPQSNIIHQKNQIEQTTQAMEHFTGLNPEIGVALLSWSDKMAKVGLMEQVNRLEAMMLKNGYGVQAKQMKTRKVI
jgi:hypothetical protein